ncbi:MAG: ABC transporter ATP-binding protein [Bacteroidia bacterium]|nr:ABC transporter ATP-binding protein [Bacteroidia bacterium]
MLIELAGVKKSFGNLQVLKGIDLTVKPAEVVSIVGASGAGKTTLLQILGTLDRPDGGTLKVKGTNVYALNGKSLAQFRNKEIGFIFQFHHLLPEFTALENVCIPAYINGREKEETESKARELLDYLNISERADHKPSELSGGEQQRVAVARALINNPALILADEPSGNLDSVHAKELHQLFFDLRDKFGQTFVIVTHNAELADMADRKVEMKDGKIV